MTNQWQGSVTAEIAGCEVSMVESSFAHVTPRGFKANKSINNETLNKHFPVDEAIS
jgi:hypothetical protein